MTTFLVTGASGFLGSHTIEALVEKGLQVRALVRRQEQIASIEAMGAECVLGTLDQVEGLRDAVRGIDGVIHCAGGGKVQNVRQFYVNNVETTENLLEAIRLEGPTLKRFIHVSSMAAQGPSPDGIPRDEKSQPLPVSHYGRSKLAAEQLVLGLRETFPVSILRPPAIYGPRDTRWLPMFRGAAKGVLPMVGGQRFTSLIYGPDCAQAICLLATTEHPSGWLGCIEDGHRYDWQLLGELIVEAMGARSRTLKVPVAALGLAARVNEYVGRLRKQPVALNRDKFEDMRQPYWVCRAEALRALGWTPQVGFAEGARRTAQWYREHDWL